MTSREREVLELLVRSGNRLPVKRLALRMGIGHEYCRLICAGLLRQFAVRPEDGEVVVLTAEGRAALRGYRPSFSLDAASPPATVRPRDLNCEVVQEVAHALSGAVQESIRRQLTQAAVPLPATKEPVTIRTVFDPGRDETQKLETNIGEPTEEQVPELVSDSVQALTKLRR